MILHTITKHHNKFFPDIGYLQGEWTCLEFLFLSSQGLLKVFMFSDECFHTLQAVTNVFIGQEGLKARIKMTNRIIDFAEHRIHFI